MENSKNNEYSCKNRPSDLLSHEENEKVFMVLGKRCSTLATSVVQLFVTELPHHSQWHKKCCGVVCFVKDGIRRSYYIKVFDMDKGSFVWEQELYHQFEYNVSKPFFHTFEADACMAGLNFADNKEASVFETAVQNKLKSRYEKKLEKRRLMSATPTNAGVIASSRGKSESMPSLTISNEKSGRRQKKKKLTKADIGTPMDFQHVQHVGFDPETGFDIRHLDPDMEQFFSIVGVSDKDLKDSETRNFIYDFIDKNGGVQRAKEELSSILTIVGSPQPPPLPAREVPQTPHVPRTAPGTRTAAPPPPPSVPPVAAAPHFVPVNSSSRNTCAPPPPPARVPPPPKPVAKSLGPPSTAVPPPPPPPPPPTSVPPPPPPPPVNIASGGGPPPPPPLPAFLSNGNGSGDARSALMEQIRKGKELNPVEINGDSSVPPNNSSGDARGALLSQIRQGVELKRVSGESKSLPPAAPMQGLAGALARALMERNRAIHLTDESDSAEDEDDDEWDD